MSEWHAHWLSAIHAATATPDAAARYLDGRLRFTTVVAQALAPAEIRFDPLVYGVWLTGHDSPIYIGQTLEGRRRLWDLPIGESHHLANSFPPEIWSRVVAVYWEHVLSERPALLEVVNAAIAPIVDRSMSRSAIGLGLEHLLQKRYQPLFNRRKKRRDGSWRVVAWEGSGSVGARVAPCLGDIFGEIVSVWERLANITSPAEAVVEFPDGRVVFPTALKLL